MDRFVRFEPCGIPLCDDNGCVPEAQETVSLEMTTTSLSTKSQTQSFFGATSEPLPTNSSRLFDEEEIDVEIVDNRGLMPTSFEFEIRSKILSVKISY